MNLILNHIHSKKHKDSIERRILNYVFLTNQYYRKYKENDSDTIKIKEHLKNKIKELSEEDSNRYVQKKNIADMIICLPTCCTDLIYEYQYVKSSLKLLDIDSIKLN